MGRAFILLFTIRIISVLVPLVYLLISDYPCVLRWTGWEVLSARCAVGADCGLQLKMQNPNQNAKGEGLPKRLQPRKPGLHFGVVPHPGAAHGKASCGEGRDSKQPSLGLQ